MHSLKAALNVDAAGLKAQKYPALLRDRIVGIEKFRPATWINPYKTLLPSTITSPGGFKDTFKKHFNDFEPKQLVYGDYHLTEWKLVTDDALARRGATIQDGYWAEMELLR